MRLFSSFFALGVLTVSTVASARSHRVDDIPNGGKLDCLNCHQTQSGEHFTDFGSDVRANLMGDGNIRDMQANWAALYAKDSDGDSYTNGEELGDPDGLWAIGQPDPAGPTFNPGDDESFPPGVCGNGVLEPDEDCGEGTEITETCVDVDMGEGELSCESCRFVFRDCTLGSGGGATGGSSGSDEEDGCSISSPGTTGHATPAALWTLLASLWAWRRRKLPR